METGNKTNSKAEPKQPTPKTGSGKRPIPVIPVTIGVVVVLIAIVLIAQRSADTVRAVDGKITRTIATVDQCASATLPLSTPAGSTTEAEAAAGAIFDALAQSEGVGLVTVYVDDPRVIIDYCQSGTSEPVLREIIASTGYLAQ